MIGRNPQVVGLSRLLQNHLSEIEAELRKASLPRASRLLSTGKDFLWRRYSMHRFAKLYMVRYR
jgi:hypothetical protein